MIPIRVLVVDDSVVVRRVLSEAITAQADLALAGTAASAPIALQKIPQVNPDVVVMDVEMPDMDGIEAARKMHAEWPKLPILMCSSLTEAGGRTTLRALSAGAADAIAKPSSLGKPGGLGDFASELVAKIRALGGRRESEPPPTPRLVSRSIVTSRSAQVEILALGSSTGGPNALSTVFAGLPGDLPVPIVMVQHMPPLFTRLLAERLSNTTAVKVKEAEEGEPLVAGRAYIAPGGFHLALVRDGTVVRATLNEGPLENSCRPAVDVLFRSVATLYGPGVLGAVLTGMGHDGTRGAAAIVDAGGSVIVQDEASCVVSSMPRSVAAAGYAQAVVTLDRFAAELTARAQRRGGRFAPSVELQS